LRSRSLRTSFSFSFWGLAIIDVSSLVTLLVGGFFSWNEKAGRKLTARPGDWSVGLPLGGRTLPG
jgi:hypothetical protein